jgi:hypothetical protein
MARRGDLNGWWWFGVVVLGAVARVLFRIFAWEMTPSDVVEIANSLGPEYTVVRADQYFELVREANPLPNLALENPD